MPLRLDWTCLGLSAVKCPSVHPHLEGETPTNKSLGAKRPGAKHPHAWANRPGTNRPEGELSWGQNDQGVWCFHVYGAKLPGGKTSTCMGQIIQGRIANCPGGKITSGWNVQEAKRPGRGQNGEGAKRPYIMPSMATTKITDAFSQLL